MLHSRYRRKRTMEAVKTTRNIGYGLKKGPYTGESEVDESPGGLGRLFHVPLLEEFLSVEKIYVDYEGVNPTGTHKDRIARAHARVAMEEGFPGITIGTCGNYGVSIAYYSAIRALKAVIFVPVGYTLGRLSEMKALGAEVIRVPGTYEDAVEASRRFARLNGFYDANPGSNRKVDFGAYSDMAKWIVSKVEPDAIFVPVGNGTTLAGLWRGFRGLGVRPRMVGVTTAFGNEVLRRFYGDPSEDFAETALNEPLVSEASFDAEEALNALYESSGYVFGFPDDVALRYAELLRTTTGINPLPSSALVLAGLVKFVRKFGLPDGRFVLVVTGGARGG